ncbi:MAG: hypothetical protein KDK90_28475 [Leptospiraceae bacterium]|nr:hypothetical protein [Leptospiraceae bacterium]
MSNWNEEYYDIIEFYYWEPQHIGKKKYEDANFNSMEEVKTHLLNMEVSLNHQFNYFFRLIPKEILNEIFQGIDKNIASDKYNFQSTKQINELELDDATQPDMFFIGEENQIGIEMKIGAKSSIEQVLKYAMLFYFNNLKSKRERKANLIFISKGDFSNLFPEKFENIIKLKQALNIEQIPDETKKGNNDLRTHKEGILNVAKQMSISFINYNDLNSLISKTKSQLVESKYKDSVEMLFDGLIDEINARRKILGIE